MISSPKLTSCSRNSYSGLSTTGLNHGVVTLQHLNPEIFAPAPRRHLLCCQWHKRCGLIMTQNRLRRVSMTRRALALFWCVRMNRKSRRINSEFHEVPHAHVLLQNRVRNPKMFRVLLMHQNTVDQFIAVGKFLQLKFGEKAHYVRSYAQPLRTGNIRDGIFSKLAKFVLESTGQNREAAPCSGIQVLIVYVETTVHSVRVSIGCVTTSRKKRLSHSIS